MDLAVENAKKMEQGAADTLRGDPGCVVTAGDPATEGYVSDEALKGLLVSNPLAGIEVLLRMDSLPESLVQPFGREERLLSEVICDSSLPRPVRARLLDEFVYDGTFSSFPENAVRGDVPMGLLDAPAVRKWYCAREKPGYRDIRCSNRFFFGQESKFEPTTEIDKRIFMAIISDSPAEFMINTSLAGYGFEPKYFQAILDSHSFRILEYLMEDSDGEIISPREMLFYVCANWDDNHAVKWLLRSEKRHRGLARECVDALGRNLLWYRRYFEKSRRRGIGKKNNVIETLFRVGCDPDADTAWGLSWRDMACLPPPMSDERRLYDIFIDGVRFSLEGYGYDVKEGCYIPKILGRKCVKEVKIVMRGSGRTMTWTLGEGRGIFIQETWPFIIEPWKFTMKEVEEPWKITLENVYNWRKKTNQYVFKLCKDGLFHMTQVAE